jgi:predicted transcriptional regulator
MSPAPPRPTEAELGILSVLWQLGPATVKQVHQVIAKDREFTYTAALKLMQIMREKHLLLRDDTNRSHVYWPAHSREEMLAALRAGRVSAKDKAEIRDLLGEEDQ